MTRRSTFTDQSVTYGAIGATLDPDLLRYPPAGFRPAEDSVKLGSGRDRFDRAAEELMTWGVQKGAGFEVVDVAPGTGAQYTGITYGPDGAPLADQPSARVEQRYGPDGTPYVGAGMTATLKPRGRRRARGIPMLVVYVIDEPERVGFAYGTTGDAPESGEESFILEHRDDDTVWLTIRSVLEPRGGIRRIFAPAIRRRRRELTTRELRALHPAYA
ncbi:uncharacterized protein (UPF0548 family) [Agromyces flavus]|uniref:Uncharacterized protein (UPF0548 family) n=1 Tax=Agromyces flavus TaxID=589382 RepID=A0A1H1S379_9MICO|nr:DUF1990 domain-containing protein [Agromyces flavus]MCP2368941.1 uncharacterized protein (UPF0548 family) [Agromyces flavus]GGI48398.1 hypothetical protein GCM10010932_30860 [Agromyces flavus]SDS42540.1 Uncharacterized protein, UPF0548 family [Agromyces flavus]